MWASVVGLLGGFLQVLWGARWNNRWCDVRNIAGTHFQLCDVSCDEVIWHVVWSWPSCIHHYHQLIWHGAEYGWPWEALPDLWEALSGRTRQTRSMWGLWSGQGSCRLLPRELTSSPVPRNKLLWSLPPLPGVCCHICWCWYQPRGEDTRRQVLWERGG